MTTSTKTRTIFWQQIIDLLNEEGIEYQLGAEGLHYEGWYKWHYLKDTLSNHEDYMQARKELLNNLQH